MSQTIPESKDKKRGAEKLARIPIKIEATTTTFAQAGLDSCSTSQ